MTTDHADQAGTATTVSALRFLVCSVHAVFAASAMACASAPPRGHPDWTIVPAYPQHDFGRAGCYAGGTLARRSGRQTLDRDSSRSLGPWLVLDSLTDAELLEGGTEPRHLNETRRQMAWLVEASNHGGWSLGGSWRRPSKDSLVFRDAALMAAATYRLTGTAETLTGEATVVHDIMGRDGKFVRSTWPVRIWRVPCSRVPRRYAFGQDSLRIEMAALRAMLAVRSVAAVALDSFFVAPAQAPPMERLGRREPYRQEVVAWSLQEAAGKSDGDSIRVRTSNPTIQNDTANITVTVERTSPRRLGRVHYETVAFTLVRVDGVWAVRKRVVLGAT